MAMMGEMRVAKATVTRIEKRIFNLIAEGYPTATTSFIPFKRPLRMTSQGTSLFNGTPEHRILSSSTYSFIPAFNA
jgi:hypothetical protein